MMKVSVIQGTSFLGDFIWCLKTHYLKMHEFILIIKRDKKEVPDEIKRKEDHQSCPS